MLILLIYHRVALRQCQQLIQIMHSPPHFKTFPPGFTSMGGFLISTPDSRVAAFVAIGYITKLNIRIKQSKGNIFRLQKRDDRERIIDVIICFIMCQSIGSLPHINFAANFLRFLLKSSTPALHASIRACSAALSFFLFFLAL